MYQKLLQIIFFVETKVEKIEIIGFLQKKKKTTREILIF